MAHVLIDSTWQNILYDWQNVAAIISYICSKDTVHAVDYAQRRRDKLFWDSSVNPSGQPCISLASLFGWGQQQ